MDVATISALGPEEKASVNGNMTIIDQPMKLSRKELVENKLNTKKSSSPEQKNATSQQVEHIQQVLLSTAPTKTAAKENEKENDENAQSTIVTADYIQQSMLLYSDS